MYSWPACLSVLVCWHGRRLPAKKLTRIVIIASNDVSIETNRVECFVGLGCWQFDQGRKRWRNNLMLGQISAREIEQPVCSQSSKDGAQLVTTFRNRQTTRNIRFEAGGAGRVTYHRLRAVLSPWWQGGTLDGMARSLSQSSYIPALEQFNTRIATGALVDWWLQLQAVCGYTFSGVIWRMQHKLNQSNIAWLFQVSIINLTKNHA